MIASSFRLRGVWNPLARGAGLVILPARVLVRWPDGRAVPNVDDLIVCPEHAAAVSIAKEKVDALRRLLFSSIPLERCDAAAELPESTVIDVYSYSQAKSLLNISRRIDPRIREHIRSGVRASLHRLIFVCGVENGDEQISRWNKPYTEKTE